MDKVVHISQYTIYFGISPENYKPYIQEQREYYFVNAVKIIIPYKMPFNKR